jgi:glycosyltransferase involved in cell wall biosynthesis
VNASSTIDISLILNIHNESIYLRRSLMSLERATEYARAYGLAVELVVVLDRPDAPTSEWIRAYDFHSFDTHQVCTVDNGSLGPSRNVGIRRAQGRYIATCDADDLISYNFYVKHHSVARAKGQRAIVVPQYCFAFGDNQHLCEFFGTDKVSKLAFVGYHPYISRIFAHRDLFDLLQFSDLPITEGFAYEDWHFHCDAIASGYEFAVARGTIFFYRQRKGSLLRRADQTSTRTTRFAKLLQPACFLKTCAADYASHVANERPAPPDGVSDELIGDKRCVELVCAANAIDPAIDLGGIGSVHAFSNLHGDLRPGAIYYELCKTVSDSHFSDVVLLSGRKSVVEDAEGYILGVLKGIKQLRPDSTFLILTGGPSDDPARVPQLPEGSVWLDLWRASNGCGEEIIQTLTLRLIQGLAQGGRVHIGPCKYARTFFRRYGRLIENNRLHYRFFDPMMRRQGHWFKVGADFDFLSECGAHFDAILTDNAAIAEHDRTRLDTLAHKIHVVYAQCGTTGMITRAGVSPRFLWLSRRDAQDRHDLLPALARQIRAEIPDACIDVIEQADSSELTPQIFEEHQNLTRLGPSSELRTVRPERYDALLYTAISDGLPQIVLQALALGLVVIAPDVGGVREVITDKTGILVENHPDDERLVMSYLQAMFRACDPGSYRDTLALREAGYELVRTRHCREAFLSSLAKALQL